MAGPLIIDPVGGTDPSSIVVPNFGGQPTVLQQAVGGVVTGLQQVPLAGWMFNKALTGSGLVSQDQLNGMALAAEAGPIGRATALMGEWVPQLVGGAALWNVGRKLALGAVANIGAKVVGGVEGAQAVRLAAMEGAGEVAPLLQRALGGPLRKQLADTVLMAGGSMPVGLRGSPAVLRTAEILAGNSLVGAVTAADALAEGKPFIESAREGAIAAAIGAGAEAGLTVAAKAAFTGARAIDKSLDAARAAKHPELNNYIAIQRGRLTKGIAKAEAARTESLATMAAFRSLSKAYGADEAERVFGQEYAAAVQTHRRALIKQRAAKAALKPLDAALGLDAQVLPLVHGSLRGHAPIGSGRLGEAEAVVQRAMLTVATTPEQIAKKMGRSIAQFMHVAKLAEGEHATSAGIVMNDLLKVASEAHSIYGVKATMRTGGKFLLDASHAMQSGGKGGLRRFAQTKGLDEERLAKLWGEELGEGINGVMQGAHEALRKVGVTPTKLRGNVPLLLRDDLAEDQLITRLRKAFEATGRSFEDSEATARKLVGMRKQRNSMFTGQDAINEEVGLTLKEAVEAGFPVMDDPLVAIQTYVTSAYKRAAYAKHLGPNFEVAKVLTEAAYREGASRPLAEAVVNGTLLRNYGDQGARQYAAAVNNLQAASKMTFSVFPNATQGVLTAVTHGPLNTLRFMMPGGRARNLLPTGRSYDAEVTAAGLNNSILSGWRETYLDPNIRTPLGWVADAVFTGTQFNRVEGWNRKTAAAVALYDTVRTVTMLAEGRLRGQSLATAYRKLEGLNIDPVKLTGRLKQHLADAGGNPDAGVAAFLNEQGGEFLKRVAWRGTQRTQFMPSPSTKPTFWHSPVGRVMFQFKTFALGQAGFMRDAVLSEFAHGNPLPLARMLALAPPAGEAVRYLQSQFRDDKANRRLRPDNDVERLLADVGALGGFGLVSDTVLAARNSRLLGFAVGPTASDTARLLEALASDNRGERIWNQAASMPAGRAVGFLRDRLGDVSELSIRALREHNTADLVASGNELDVPTLSEYGRTL